MIDLKLIEIIISIKIKFEYNQDYQTIVIHISIICSMNSSHQIILVINIYISVIIHMECIYSC